MNFIEKIKPEIDNAIIRTCTQIIQEPLIYFSEADFQQLLVEELKTIKVLAKLYPTSVKKGKDSKTVYKTPLIHREYGAGNNKRIDIVIFDPEDVLKIDEVNLKSEKKYLKPAFIFELGTEKTADIDKHLHNDIEKGKSVKKHGTSYIIQFYKDVTQAQEGTKTRSLTDEKIETKYKAIFESHSKKLKEDNIKLLGILIRTYRNQTKMWGKCEIFNDEKWKKTNINKKEELAEKISTILK